MSPLRSETLTLRTDEDVLRVRQMVRAWMVEQAFNVVEQTMMVTATSELARNTVVHGGGGSALIELLETTECRGVRVRFEDQGAGIINIDQALKDGYTTGVGLGLGLGGARRLVDDFEIVSEPGKGTHVTITKWK